MRFRMDDNQANLAFVRSQTEYVEAEVYATQYPDIQYSRLIPVDTSAPEFATAVTYVSTDARGSADWIAGGAMDIPLVSQSRTETKTPVYTAAIGYDWTWEEVGQARMLGVNLTPDKADTARRVAEEMIDRVALQGDTGKSFQPLLNNTAVTPVNVANNAAASSRLWSAKTSLEVLADLNEILVSVWTTSLQIEKPDTLLLPPTGYSDIATRYMSDLNPNTILDQFLLNNIYTKTTGQRLTVEAVRGLETIGVSTTRRMVAYTRRPDVVKLHIPMVHRFLEVQHWGLWYMTPGVMRLGGVDIRRPGAFRYRDAF